MGDRVYWQPHAQASGTFDVNGLLNQFNQGAGGKDMLTSLLNARV